VTESYVLLESQIKFFILQYIIKHDLREKSNREKLSIFSFQTCPPMSEGRAI